jgi:hypothetical protein
LKDPGAVSAYEPGRDHARAEGFPVEIFVDRERTLDWLAAWSDHHCRA